MPDNAAIALALPLAAHRLKAQKEAGSELVQKKALYSTQPALWASDVLGVDLIPVQRQILEALNQHRRVAVAACHTSGKALSLETPLPTPSGWTTMGAVKVGDEVFNEDGKPCRVLACSPIEERETFRVRFKDGAEIVASDEHRWNVVDLKHWPRSYAVDNRCRHRPQEVRDWRDFWGATKIVTTAQLAESLKENGQWRWRIPTAHAIQSDRPWRLRCPPYTFGAWLGDGTTVRAELTCHVDDAPHFARMTNGTIYPEKTDTVKKVWFGRDGVGCPAREIGGAKCIPAYILRASEVDRLEVLRGLMDTDGNVGNGPSVEIAVCNKELADGIAELVISLGWKAHQIARPAKLYGREVGTSYRIIFRPNLNPFRLERKAREWEEADKATGSRWSMNTQRTIVAVEPAGVRKVKCIAVDSERNLYLAGQAMIPTHNTFLNAVAVLYWLYVKDALVITTALSENLVKNQLWRDVGRLWGGHGLGGNLLQTEINGLPNGLMALGFKAADYDPQRFAGFHSPTGRILVIVDEASDVPDGVIEAVKTLVSSKDAVLLLTGNPLRTTGEFYRAFTEEESIYKTIFIDAFDTPNFEGLTEEEMLTRPKQELDGFVKLPYLITPLWAREVADDYGIDSDYYRLRVRGRFGLKGGVESIIRLEWVESAKERRFPLAGPREAGLDVAASLGGDETVLTIRQGMNLLGQHAFRLDDEVEIVARVENILGRPKDYDALKVDVIGVGKGVHDMLKAKGWPTVALNSAAEPNDKERFVNFRDEMWWNLRETFRQGLIGGEIEPLLRDQLIAISTSYPKGKIKVESKLELRKRGEGSPDRADSLVYAWAPVKRRTELRVPTRGIGRYGSRVLAGREARKGKKW